MNMNTYINTNMNTKRISFSNDTKDFDGNSEKVIYFSTLVMSHFRNKITTFEDVLVIADKNDMYIDYFISELKILEERLEELRQEEMLKNILTEESINKHVEYKQNFDIDLYCGCCSKIIEFHRQSCKNCINIYYCSVKCSKDHFELHKKDCEWDHPVFSPLTIKKKRKSFAIIRSGSRDVSNRLFTEYLVYLKKLLHLVFLAKETFSSKRHFINKYILAITVVDT